MNPETDLRFRLFIDNELVDEAWIDVTTPNSEELSLMAAERQAQQGLRAMKAGKLWMVEVYDPGRPEDEAYHRFGTDARGMVNPSVKKGLDEVLDAVNEDAARRLGEQGK